MGVDGETQVELLEILRHETSLDPARGTSSQLLRRLPLLGDGEPTLKRLPSLFRRQL